MKIDPTGKPLQTSPSNSVQSVKNRNGEADFANVLGKTLKQGEVQSIQASHGVQSVAGTALRIHGAFSTPEWRAADRLLDALEAYRTQLENPEASLKRIEPYMGRMSDLLEKIKPLMEDLPKENPVKAVLQETMVHISKEVERFNMGYYVDG